MPRRSHIKDLWKEQRLFAGRAVLAAFFVVGMLLLVVGRVFYLTVARHGYYLQASQGNRIRFEPLPANRGLILDRNGTVLVDNQPGFQLGTGSRADSGCRSDTSSPRRDRPDRARRYRPGEADDPVPPPLRQCADPAGPF